LVTQQQPFYWSTIQPIVDNDLCIGCGICAAVCTREGPPIRMEWSEEKGLHLPFIDPQPSTCDGCKACILSCPVSAKPVIKYAEQAQDEGLRYGIGPETKCYVGCESDEAKRVKSASGGIVSAFLSYVLETGEVDGVIATRRLMNPKGQPHSEAFIARTTEELDEARGTNYGPHQYVEVLKEVAESDGTYAFIGVPCVLRGMRKVSGRLRKKIKFMVSLPCKGNFSSHMTDYVATRFGVKDDEPFVADLSDKKGISACCEFNFCIKTEKREERRSNLDEHFTGIIGAHMFAFDCCTFCPDFFGVDADLCAKDAWGPPLKNIPEGIHNPPQDDATGASYFVTRNPEVDRIIHKMHAEGRLILGNLGADEMGQEWATRFKHVDVADRMWQHPYYKAALEKRKDDVFPKPSPRAESVRQYRMIRRAQRLTWFFHRRVGWLSAHVSIVPIVLAIAAPIRSTRQKLEKMKAKRQARAKARAKAAKARAKAAKAQAKATKSK
jgi:coenzyme F420 hydrogenase subunit beta